jgi:hypothetical protein
MQLVTACHCDVPVVSVVDRVALGQVPRRSLPFPCQYHSAAAPYSLMCCLGDGQRGRQRPQFSPCCTNKTEWVDWCSAGGEWPLRVKIVYEMSQGRVCDWLSAGSDLNLRTEKDIWRKQRGSEGKRALLLVFIALHIGTMKRSDMRWYGHVARIEQTGMRAQTLMLMWSNMKDGICGMWNTGRGHQRKRSV